MIFKRLKKSTPDAEANFSRQLQEEKVGIQDYVAMLGSAFMVLVVPSILALLAFCGIIMLIFGIF